VGVTETMGPRVRGVRGLSRLFRQAPCHVQVCFKGGQGVGGKVLELGICALSCLGAEELDVCLMVLHHLLNIGAVECRPLQCG
jgi:hypothetical protein